jgi:surfeit locus 1 family protein
LKFPTDFQWQPNWKILLFVAVFLPTTVLLSFWQLDRAEEKKQILAAQDAQQQLLPLTNKNWQQDSSNSLRQVDLQLDFDADRYLLLANRLIEGQVGYEVIALAAAAEDASRVQLVNRGWVLASLNREELPELEPVTGVHRVQGYYYCPEANSMISQSTEFTGEWPALIYSLDGAAMQQIFDVAERPIPCEIRLNRDSPLAFHTGWQIINQSVDKHIGYAVQWFLMAIALIILALFSNSNLGAFFHRGNSQ